MLISVCLPTFNGARYVASAIESVLAQTHNDLELLIGDDCSSDQTYELVEELARADSRIKCWRNKERLGLFANYNSCIERARGELIKPFAQDDSLERIALGEMAAVLSRERSIELVSTQRRTGELYAGAPAVGDEERLPPGAVAGKTAILSCLEQYRNLIGEPVAVMYRSSSKDLSFDSAYHSLGDLDLWMRILERGDLWCIEQPLVLFRQHAESETMALMENMDWVLDFYRLSRQYEHYLKELGSSREQFCLRFTELAGALITKLESEGKLKVSELTGFREVAYYSMRRCAELSFKGREYDSIVNSTSWRITRPLRTLANKLSHLQ